MASLSTSWYGGEGMPPSSSMRTRLGPMAPRCSQTEAEPGPPLNEKVSGRLSAPPARSAT